MFVYLFNLSLGLAFMVIIVKLIKSMKNGGSKPKNGK